jgi:hypothetical protein
MQKGSGSKGAAKSTGRGSIRGREPVWLLKKKAEFAKLVRTVESSLSEQKRSRLRDLAMEIQREDLGFLERQLRSIRLDEVVDVVELERNIWRERERERPGSCRLRNA